MQAELNALRGSVALSRMDHVTHARLSGADAFAVLDRVCPAELLLRDGQFLHTLLLRDDGRPLADLYVGRDDEEFLLVAEGLAPAALDAHLREHAAGARISVELLDRTHEAWALSGPYSWELLGEVIGPEIIGLPFANLFHVDEWLCFRAGKTGEYGYELLIPREQSDAARARLEEIGRRFDLGHAGLDALDHCALENWFFNIRREGAEDVTPLELQLQWRVSRRKQYVGAEALRRRRAEGVRQRLTYVVGPDRFAAGDSAFDGEHSIGRVVNAGFCEPRGEWVGLALLERSHACSGIGGLSVGAARAALRTISPPAFANRSLFVNPQRHSYLTRDEDPLPPLVIA